MADIMEIEVLEDGTVSVTTDKISGTNHYSADEFMNELADVLGGGRKTTKRKEGVGHTHRVNGRTIHHTH
jgi:hypothetical protein